MTDRMQELDFGLKNEFVETTKRAVRRAIISSELKSEKDGIDKISLGGVIQNVRDIETRRNVDSGIGGLTIEYFPVDEPTMKMTREIYDSLHDKFPFVKAIVILGSSANGGTVIRNFVKEESGAEQNGDFDWAVMVDPGIYYDQMHRKEMLDYRNAAIPIISKYGRMTCWGFNPTTYYESLPEEPSYFDEIVSDEIIEDAKFGSILCELLLFIQPSYPQVVNEASRRLFYQWMMNLRVRDESLFNKLLAGLHGEWQRIHVLKPKYFGGNRGNSEDNRDSMITKSVALSKQVLPNPFTLKDLKILAGIES